MLISNKLDAEWIPRKKSQQSPIHSHPVPATRGFQASRWPFASELLDTRLFGNVKILESIESSCCQTPINSSEICIYIYIYNYIYLNIIYVCMTLCMYDIMYVCNFVCYLFILPRLHESAPVVVV